MDQLVIMKALPLRSFEDIYTLPPPLTGSEGTNVRDRYPLSGHTKPVRGLQTMSFGEISNLTANASFLISTNVRPIRSYMGYSLDYTGRCLTEPLGIMHIRPQRYVRNTVARFGRYWHDSLSLGKKVFFARANLRRGSSIAGARTSPACVGSIVLRTTAIRINVGSTHLNCAHKMAPLVCFDACYDRGGPCLF